MRNITRIFGLKKSISQAAISAESIRVACVGDSITVGVGAGKGDDYPAQLGRVLGDKFIVKNFGVSGSTMLKRGDRPYHKKRAFRKAKAFNPDIVVIKLGTNDTKLHNWKFKAEFIVDYKDMVNQFRGLPRKPKIFLLCPAPVTREDKFGVNEERLQEIIRMIDRLAVEIHAGVIDVHTPLFGHPEWIPDGVHPNTEGATVIAMTVYRALSKIQKREKLPVELLGSYIEE